MKISSLVQIIAILNKNKVQYLVVGGLAVNAWNVVRPTKDLDLVIKLDLKNIRLTLQALLEIGYKPYQHVSAEDLANPSKRREWKEEKGMIVLKMWSDEHVETPIDIFIEEPFDFLKEFSRALPHEIEPKVAAHIVTLGTLLKMKQLANRTRDLEDIRALKDLYGL